MDGLNEFTSLTHFEEEKGSTSIRRNYYISFLYVSITH